MKRSILLIILSIVTQALPAAESLVIYSGRSDKLVKPVIDQFSKETGIEVILHAGKSPSLLSKLKLEGDRTSADLFLSNDAGTLETGRQLDLFQAVDSAIAERIPANYRAEDNKWIGLAARARVLVINTNLVKPDQIKSVFDLADPAYKDKIGITPATNDSFIAGVTVYTEKLGEQKVTQWLKGVKHNAGNHVFEKHRAIVKDVAEGKLAVGLVNHYYIFRHLDNEPDAPIKMLLPDQGASDIGIAWNVSGIAWVKHSHKKDSVNKLLDYLSSHQGQALLARLNREYPVSAGVETDKVLPDPAGIKVADVPMAALGQQRNRSVDMIEALGMK